MPILVEMGDKGAGRRRADLGLLGALDNGVTPIRGDATLPVAL
jgi:hypothetical protein